MTVCFRDQAIDEQHDGKFFAHIDDGQDDRRNVEHNGCEVEVFFDGRSDFYGAEFLKRYGRMVQVRPGWREIWDSFHFTHALVPNDYPLVPALEHIGWRRVYRDATATLLVGGGT